MSSSDSCSTETSSDDPGGGVQERKWFGRKGLTLQQLLHIIVSGGKKNNVHLQLWGKMNLGAISMVISHQVKNSRLE